MYFEADLIDQKSFFNEGKTLDYKYRKIALLKLKKEIINKQSEIEKALYEDLGKSKTESYMTEIGMVLEDLTYQIKHLKGFMKVKKCKTPLAQFKATSYQKPSPYGQVLVIAPWNYPFLLAIQPLVGAVAAGNVVVLKPSEYANATAKVIKMILESVFEDLHVLTILGDAKVSTTLLNHKWDYIFFTGGSRVGKIVYEKASQNLTPVTLELGGKSPCIIDKTAKIDLACKRIVFGKFLNCGQTCVAPDYLLVEESIKEDVITSLKKWIDKLYPDALKNEQYGKIINENHYKRLKSFINPNLVVYGGNFDDQKMKIEPTVLYPVQMAETVMNEEIFGPILPILTYNSLEELFAIIAENPTPLALYLFTNNKKMENLLTSKISFGGGCINDTIIHLATTQIPFGGVGNSGIGSYHGKQSFMTFTHYKSIVKKANMIDLPIRYTPYNELKSKLIKMFLK